MKAIFLIGRPPPSHKSKVIQVQLEQEQLSYCDLLQFDFMEDIANNTLKQLHAMQYIYQKLSIAPGPPEYFVRTDDDIFFNIPILDRVLKDMERSYRFALLIIFFLKY